MNRCIMVLDASHIDAVNALRMSEYSSAQGFKVDAPGILWNKSDDQSTILGVYEGQDLIATLRLELIQDLSLVERKMECPWSFPVDLRFPVLVLSKMATARVHRKRGLSLLLRYHALKVAMDWGALQALGTFTKGSPRENSMGEMGYEFHENTQGWHAGDYKSTDPVLVAILDLQANGAQALDVCRARSSAVFDDFPFRGAPPPRRFVEVVK